MNPELFKLEIIENLFKKKSPDIKIEPTKPQNKKTERKRLIKLSKTLKLLFCVLIFMVRDNGALNTELYSFVFTTGYLKTNKLFSELRSKIRNKLGLSPQNNDTVSGFQKKCTDSGASTNF